MNIMFASFFLTFTLILGLRADTPITFESILRDAFVNIGKECRADGLPPLDLNDLKVDDLDLSNMIFGGDTLNVNLSRIHLYGLENYTVSPILPLDNKREQYLLTIKFPIIAVDAYYAINGSLYKTFHVKGKGPIDFKYRDVQCTINAKVGFLHNEKYEKNSLKIVLQLSLDPFSVHFQNVTITHFHKMLQFQKDDPPAAPIHSPEHQLGSIVFWRIISQLSTVLKNYFPNCINDNLSKVKIPDNIFPEFPFYHFPNGPLFNYFPINPALQTSHLHSSVYPSDTSIITRDPLIMNHLLRRQLIPSLVGPYLWKPHGHSYFPYH